MAAGDYTITVTVGSWSVTMDKGDVASPTDDAIALDPLNAGWQMTGRGYPSQPAPVVVSFGLYVPDVATGPEPVQGDHVEVILETPDHDPLSDHLPVFDFVGQITDVDATPLSDGLRFSIVAVEYRNALANERVGDEPWPAESREARLERLVLLSGQELTIPADELLCMQFAGLGPSMAARDIDSQPTASLLDDVLAAGVTWMDLSPGFWITGYIDGTFRAPELCTWLRPMVSQSVDALGNVSFPIVYLTGGGPDDDASLPYNVALVAGTLELQRKAIEPATDTVSWIPSSAVELAQVKWRQDKATNTNRVRVKAPSIIAQNFTTVGSITGEFPDLVESNGPNEVTLETDAAQGDYLEATDLVYAILGRYYDASPRWALDSFTILPEQIADGDQWPRLFNPREHINGAYDQAAGRFVLITDVDPRWSLHDRPDYFGRLAGASLTLQGGKLRLSATLAHRLPWGVGVPIDPLAHLAGPPVHHPITYAELAAGANPDYNQCGDLTPADLQLVES